VTTPTPRRKRQVPPLHRHQLAVKNGRSGGNAWAKKAKSRPFGLDKLREAMRWCRQRTEEIYGGTFANLQIPRNKERQRRACQAAGKAGGLAAGKARRARRDAKAAKSHPKRG
jgi:hypothetical protein